MVYFERLIGNDETKRRVGRAIESGQIPHAFLIGGPSGSGKSTLSAEMAAAINCESRHKDNSISLPCGQCNNCRRIYEGNFPDLKILKRKKDRATLGVDAVKDFREDMFLSSTEAEYKIYVIDDAESMTPEAQNALLKVLEEPPRSVIIILLAKECDRILTTIKSRAQYISMSRFDEETLTKTLLRDSVDARAMKIENEAAFRGIIMSADGRLGLAKELLSKRLAKENEEERAQIISLITATVVRPSYADIYSVISAFPTKRGELALCLEKLMSALRDLIVTRYSPEAHTIFFATPEEAARIRGSASARRLTAIYDAVSRAHELCARNANVSNLLACLCSEIRLAANY